MRRIAFYVINGIGMGHVHRCLAIATAIRKSNKDVDIAFVSWGSHKHIYDMHGFASQILEPLTGQSDSDKAIRDRNIWASQEFLEEFQADSLVIDAIPFTKAFPHELLDDHRTNIVVLRKLVSTLFGQFVQQPPAHIHHILVPHSWDELEYTESDAVVATLRDSGMHTVCGPIVRVQDDERGMAVRPRTANGAIVVTAGGGGMAYGDSVWQPERAVSWRGACG